jgi:uncharacterized protein YndB with AHSA1/START domain
VIEPLDLSFDIACEPAHAFEVWTSQFDRWWPRGHSVSGDPAAIVLEPCVGGRIFERTADGTEIDWGEVTVWDPPVRFGYLWHIRRDRADATDVELTFADAGDGTTHLRILHTGWERLGAGAQEWRDANRGGWGGLLPHFTTYIATSNEES